MEVLFFAYTILIMISCIAAATSMFSSYAITHNRLYFYISVAFLLYFLDLSFIFQSEYLNRGQSVDVSVFYAIREPFVKALISAGVLETVWIALCHYLDKKSLPLIIAPAAVFLAATSLIVILMSEGPFKQWCFYTAREVFVAWFLLFLLLQYRTASTAYKARIRKLKVPVIFAAILCICIIVENTFVILIWNPSPEFMNSAASLFMSERSISENLLAPVLAVSALHHSMSIFRLRHKDPPASPNPTRDRYVDSNIDLYCEKYGLTKRERDVLHCAIAGKDYQNTASELCLAVGTIKSHTHNILQKTGSKTRQELIQDFWRS